ncbi:uncharacterized protein BJ212DRAFT_1307692 [Suillus subaureus]|uniref:Uncharacterized protein n=1 Tax=Suillus subaureus TaxID=48587 RepID=A0A9P7AJD7_9AGAM|nr:uncharacterized protein BJ212DRAFT_1307692 [Suillus subaureus]KAG1790744.1 hypothetical protein BJ212DRAFT_1307692 [Suillus subaureus]
MYVIVKSRGNFVAARWRRMSVLSLVMAIHTLISKKSVATLLFALHCFIDDAIVDHASDQWLEHSVPKAEHPTIVRGTTRLPSTRPPHPEHPVWSLHLMTQVFEESGAPGPSKFEEGRKLCTKRTLSQAEIDYWLYTVRKAARKE